MRRENCRKSMSKFKVQVLMAKGKQPKAEMSMVNVTRGVAAALLYVVADGLDDAV